MRSSTLLSFRLFIVRCLTCGFLLTLGGCRDEIPAPVGFNSADEDEPSNATDCPIACPHFSTLQFQDFTAFVSKPEGDAPAWSLAEDGIIRTTGSPRGYLLTKKSYGKFTFIGEFRFVPGENPPDTAAMDKYNTGFLIYVPEEQKIWPRSLEVQGRYDLMGQVKSNARDLSLQATFDDQAARETARKPIGEWNEIEIRSENGAVTVFLNGSKVSECAPGELTAGRIGLQAEDYAVEFRNLRIHEE